MKILRRSTFVLCAIPIAATMCYVALSVFRNTAYTTFSNKMKNDTCKIIAHRGGAGLGAENTLSCIERGIAAGADAVEIDVHLTADGALVVCHDPSVDRTTDGQGRIADMTLQEIRALHVTEDGKPTAERIPTLGEVLHAVGDRTQVLLEIKKDGRGIYEGIERKVLCEIRRHGPEHRITVQSFSDEVLEELHRQAPEIRLEKLFFCKLWGLPVIFDGGFSRLSFEKYAYVRSFNIHHRSLNKRLLKKIHRHGQQVKIWTADDPSRTAKLPVDGVITNRPDRWVDR